MPHAAESLFLRICSESLVRERVFQQRTHTHTHGTLYTQTCPRVRRLGLGSNITELMSSTRQLGWNYADEFGR